MEINEFHRYFLECEGASTDTRKIKIGDMFFALKGDNFDGNKYADKAVELGAKYAVIDDEKYKASDRFFLVDDVLTALQNLAKYHREQLKTTIISLTGSNGKTTTKELINAVLSKKYNTVATIGNLNNHIGVPLTLLRLKKSTEIGIVEMGANHLKEIEFLCKIAQPDYGLITNFGKAHLEGFGSVEGVIKGKSELYNYLADHDKTIIADTDDEVQMRLVKEFKGFGSMDSSQDEESVILLDSNENLVIDYGGDQIQTQISGAYNYKNIKYAIAIGEHFKVGKNQIIEAISNYKPDNNRSQNIIRGTNTIILDAYNANPSSMTAALESFEKKQAKHKIAILGDMFELGKDAGLEHQQIRRLAGKMDIDSVYLVGKNFYAVDEEGQKFKKFETFDDFKEFIQQEKPSESLILIKGSRGMALERTLEYL